MEEWRDVVGFEGLYEVSSEGRVKRLDRWVPTKLGSRRFFRGTILEGHTNRRGYRMVKMFGKSRLVHQLVCAAFHGPKPSPLHEVAHGGDDKANNRDKNLRWATHAENSAEAARLGLYNRGEKVAAGKLTAEQVLEIRRRHNGQYGIGKALAVEFGVRQENIIAIVKRRAWTHI